jgi:hypothetical protein
MIFKPNDDKHAIALASILEKLHTFSNEYIIEEFLQLASVLLISKESNHK